jgi:hypothetical protein
MSGLTKSELHALDLTTELVKVVNNEIIADGPTREQDVREFVALIHLVQQMIMAQAAARAHPDLLRLLGESLRADTTT